MRDVLLYIGVSLDGYIADREGRVDFLDGAQAEGEVAYERFAERVDTVLMGYGTYRQVTEELSPGQWPYDGMDTYLFTHRPVPEREGLHVVEGPVEPVVERLRCSPGRGIWLCGGGDLIAQLWRAGLVDELWLTVVPRVLGGGVPLFPGEEGRRALRLISGGRCGDTLLCRYRVE